MRTDHPVFRPFSEPHSGSFATAKFFRHAKLEPSGNSEVLARFDNGDPVLVSVNIDKGRVLVFTSSADDTSNDLPLKAVYAPLWQQMLRYVENYQEGRRWLQVGDTMAPRKLLVEAALKQGKGNIDLNQPLVVVDPSRERLPVSQRTETVGVDAAGFYEIRTMSVAAQVAVNTVPRESDLAHGNSEEMVAGWMPTDRNALPVAQDERLSAEQQDQRQRLWLLPLLAALILLVSESILSNRSVVKSEP
jgi:hypothetical protein